MKVFAILSLLIVASTSFAANAAQVSYSDYSDIDVVSVAPRSPHLKPFVMASFTKEQLARVAAAAPKKVASKAQD
jgi:hypothetical protein